MSKLDHSLSKARAAGASPQKQSTERRSPRLLIFLSVGLVLVAVSWWLRSSPWARENSLGIKDVPQLEESVRLQPNDFLARYYLAKRYYMARRFSDALAAYEEAIRLEPQSPRAHLGLGLTLMELGDVDRAKTEFETTLKYEPHTAWAEHMLGKIAWQRGDANTALHHARRAAEQDPRAHPSWYFLAVCYIQLNRFDEGLAALRHAIAREDGNARYHTALGELLVYRGLTEEGQKHLERAIEINPNFGPACALLGSFYFRKVPGTEAVNRAQELLQRATRLRTYHMEQVYFDLGELYLQKGEFIKAKEALKMSIYLDPRDERPYFSLVKVYRRLGDLRAAADTEAKFQRISKNHVQLKTLEAQVFHNANNAEARLQLARLYRDLGMTGQAATQYSAYMHLNPRAAHIAREMDRMIARRQPPKKPVERPDYVLPPIR